MFAPLGYLPFATLATSLMDHADAFFEEVAVPWEIINRSELGLEKYRKATAARVIYFRWLVDHCLWRQPVPIYLASPDAKLGSGPIKSLAGLGAH